VVQGGGEENKSLSPSDSIMGGRQEGFHRVRKQPSVLFSACEKEAGETERICLASGGGGEEGGPATSTYFFITRQEEKGGEKGYKGCLASANAREKRKRGSVSFWADVSRTW